ncbi:MAG TPA: hypothetical protein PLY50_01600 [Burkholderiaceae bacterium]|nr:hypothetical protein [Burkholderiaceae bacterium]
MNAAFRRDTGAHAQHQWQHKPEKPIMFKRDPLRPPPSLSRLLALAGLTAGLLLAGQARAGATTPAQQLAPVRRTGGRARQRRPGQGLFDHNTWRGVVMFALVRTQAPPLSPGLDKRYQRAVRDD